MKTILVGFLLIISVCYGQKNTYVLNKETQRSNKALSRSTIYFDVTVNKSTSKKEFPNVLTIKAIESKTTDPQPFHFSSLCIDSNKNITTSTQLIELSVILDQPIYFSVDKQIISLDTISLKKALQAKLDKWQIKKEYVEMVNNNILFQANLIQTILYPKDISKKVIKKLHTVPQQLDKRLYRMTDNKGNKTYISYQDSDRTLNGELVLDKTTGQTIALEQRHNYESNNISYSSSISLNTSETSIKNSYDVTYADILIKGSFLSNALNTDEELDSLKVMQYITSNEKQFGTDRDFIQGTLNLLQHIDNFRQYNLLLNRVPVNLLAGTHHLSNLVTNGDHTREKFMAIIPLLEDNSRYKWIQNYLYPFQNRIKKGDYISKEEQIELLLNGFSDTEKRYIYPMVLGQNIVKNRSLPTRSKQYISDLMALNDDYWIDGNAGRYVLMAYQSVAAIDTLYAQHLLDNIITRLSNIYNDKTKKNSKITRTHLATAYYLAYQRAKDVDKSRAMLYLEKAAQYSPKSKADMDYNSGYDIKFLKVKESYADDYFKELASSGQKDPALQKYIAEFLTGQGNSYYGLRDFYHSNYPHKKFDKFFLSEVIPLLEDAPDFTLHDLNNQKVSKNDLKGKWTLVDFWGTWCVPCVAEMPKLNRFYKELKRNKLQSDKVGLVTIACHDTEHRVKSFLEKNRYNIPVLMSDNKVEQSFKVPGYPGKYILTPTGKMIAIPFGFDWEPLLEEMATFKMI